MDSITESLMEWRNRTDFLKAERNAILQLYENSNILESQIKGLINAIHNQKKTCFRMPEETLIKLQKQHNTCTNNLNQVRITLQQKVEEWNDQCKNLIYAIKESQAEILGYVDKFQYDQKLAGNGAPFDNNLDRVQSWCETLGGIWLNLRSELDFMTKYYPSREDDFAMMQREAANMVGQLVKRTFIVEKQPPQVLKTNTKFSSTVRSLIGGLLISNTTSHHIPIVRASILNETQARMMMQASDDTPNDTTSGAILNRESHLECHPTTKQSIANFRTMTLKKITRTEKKGTESVMDEKFAILFQTIIKIAAGELVFYVKTLSLPLVVIVHGNQENHAWATVTWDNAFAQLNRVPFIVPDKVPWARVGQVLSTKFVASVGCELAAEDLRFLAGKAFRDFNLPEYDQLLLSWAQFAKEPIPDRNFTFWEWFYSILKLTREHLKDLWRPENRLIYGFIGRKQTEDALFDKPYGTFLLRYSETELGCITIAYKAETRTGTHNSIFMIKPFNQKDIQTRSLADRINDLKCLKYLYPDIPKDQAFGKFYAPMSDAEPTAEGYIPPLLVTHIPVWASGGIDSFPSTPHSNINTQSPSMNEIYGDPPSSVGSLSSDVRLNVESISSFQDVDLYNIMNDVDYDMDDIPADLSGVGLNDLLANANGFNCFASTKQPEHE